MPKVLEITSYHLKPGAGAEFHEVVQTCSLPLLAAAGIPVVIARPSLHDPDVYVLIRAYDSLDQMRERHADFYGSSAWLEGPRERVLACIDTYTTTVFKADVAWLVALSTALAPR